MSLTMANLIVELSSVIDIRRNIPAPDGQLIPLPEYIARLPVFLSPIKKTMDETAVLTVRNRLVKGSRYSPRLYETMLSEAADLLNRCESYRNDANETASLAIGGAFDLVARESARTLQKKVFELKTAEANTIRINGYHTASEIFGNDSPLAEGEGILAQTESDFISKASDLEDEKVKLSKSMITIEESLDHAIRIERQIVGGSLNYVDQYKSLTDIFAEDLDEAYERLMAAETGLRSNQAGFMDIVNRTPLPKVGVSEEITENDLKILDNLIIWIRRMIRELDAVKLLDHEFIVCLTAGDDSETFSVLGKEAVENAFKPTGNGELNFTVNESHLPTNFRNFRLISIGVSLLPRRGYETSDEVLNAKYAVVIDLPPQKFIMNTGFAFDEPSAKLCFTAGTYRSDLTYFESSGPRVAYSSPFGAWKVTIAKTGITSVQVIGTTEQRFRGIVIFLRMVGRS